MSATLGWLFVGTATTIVALWLLWLTARGDDNAAELARHRDALTAAGIDVDAPAPTTDELKIRGDWPELTRGQRRHYHGGHHQ